MSAGRTLVIVAGQSNAHYCPDTRLVTDPKYSPVVGVEATTGHCASYAGSVNIKIKPPQTFSQVLSYPTTYTPLTLDRRFGCAIQPMAWALKNTYGHDLTINEWAEGSTGLSTDWMPAGGGKNCYRNLVQLVKSHSASPYARQPLATAARTVLLWWQSENDAATTGPANAYAANFTTFIGQLRTDLSLPSLKVLMVKLSASSGQSFATTVRAQQVLFAAGDGGLTTLLSIDSFTIAADLLHFNSTVAEQIGLTALAPGIDGMV